jgi:hypothetical protein
MATTKVSELAALTTPDGAEELLINDGGTSKKITLNNAIIAGTGITRSGATISASPVALTTIQTAANQVAQLALTTEEGDVVVRTDESKTYMHNGGSAGSMSDFTEMATPTGGVTSVNSVTGAVTAAHIATAVEAASDSNTFTDADHTKLNAIEASATADQSASEIKTLLEDGIDSVHYVDGSIDTAHIADDQVTVDKLANSINTDIATGVTAGTVAAAALPKAGGAMTGAITTNSTFDGVDIATRDAILTSTTTTAGAALPKAGGTMTGNLAFSSDGEVSSTAGYMQLKAEDTLYLHYDTDGGGSESLVVRSGSSATERMRIDSSGKVSINNSITAGTDTDTSNTGSITLDFATNQNFVLTLTGNVTLANPTTEVVGQSGFITLIQDGTGSRTVSLGTDYETAAGAGLTLTSTASATDIVPYVVAAAGRILLGTPQLAFA